MRFEFTKEINKKLLDYQKEHLLTIEQMMNKAGLSKDAFFRFKRRGIIWLQSLRKIKENIWVDLLKN